MAIMNKDNPPSRSVVRQEQKLQPDAERHLMRQLRRVNLDLLPILSVLLRTRNVSATARYFGLSQPAVSKSLRQLRVIFEDELLAVSGRSVSITERGTSLIAPLSKILDGLGALIEPARSFDPTTEALSVSINTADYVSSLLAPELDKICARQAPNVVFHFVEQITPSSSNLKEFDVVIAPRPIGRKFGKRMHSKPLWQDDMVCIVATKNRQFGNRVTGKEFELARHIAYQRIIDTPIEVAALIQPTSTLEVSPAFTVSDFLVLGAIVEAGESAALVPRMLAMELVRMRSIRTVELVHSNRTLDVDLYWSSESHAKRGHKWIIQVLVDAAKEVTARTPIDLLGARDDLDSGP